ncbi:MAG: GspH/FimT family pseudopilin [Woeseiaceae bacterium]|nr:GspH/FimT family pseudopilin [Woeseiaceae bacterium]
MPDRTPRGYSLYELIGTIAIASLVLSLGIPSFGRVVAEHRLKVDVDALFHAIHLARKESVMRRREVTLCPSANGRDCLPVSDWSTGWIMFVNLDRDSPAHRDTGEAVLKQHAAGLHNLIQANRRSFSFRTTQYRATNGTFTLCDKAGRAPARRLIVSYTGRPRVRLAEARTCPVMSN